MHYLLFLLPLAILLLCPSHSTWAPFQSNQVKEICAHMTAAERSRTIGRAACFGATLGVLLGAIGFTGMLMGKWLFGSVLMAVVVIEPVILILMGLALWKLKPRMDRSQKMFLASMQWSKDEGLRPDNIVLRRS